MKESSNENLEENMTEGDCFLDEMITQHEALSPEAGVLTDTETGLNSPEQDIERESIGERILSHEGRSAMLYLMKNGPVLASKRPNLFQAIEQEVDAIRRVLAEMFGVLVFDPQNGVAFLTDGTSEESLDDEEEPKSLFTRRRISLYDSLVLIVLRKHYQDREVAGDTRIEIDDEAIQTELVPLLQLSNSERSDERTLNGTINKLLEKKIVAKVHGKPGRYEITPLIRYVVSAAYLQKMKDEFEALLEKAEGNQADGRND